MATRTAPAVDGTPNLLRVSMHWIDASGDLRSTSIYAAADAANADIEALVASMQLASNASLYKVEVTEVYNSIPAVSNATAGVYPSVYDNVVILAKDQLNHSQNLFIPAPDATVMGTSSDTPIVAAVAAMALLISPVLEGGGTDVWSIVSARFTERREKNQRVFI